MNPLRQAHRKFVKIITYPSIVKNPNKQANNRHFNLTCFFKGHVGFIDFNEKQETCTRCGKLEKL